MRWSPRAFFLVAAAAAAAVPGAGYAATPPPVAITAILPLTGSAAFIGVSERQSLEALQSYVNATGGIRGRKLAFDFVDHETNPQISVQFTNAVIARHDPAFIDGSPASTCNADGALVKSGPVMYCLSPGIIPPAGSYVFSSEVDIDDSVAATVRYLRLRGWNKLAIITSTDASGQITDRSLDHALAALENRALTVVDREHFAPGDISVAAQVTRMQNAKPDAIIAWSTGTPIANVFRQFRDSGVNLPVATTNGNMTYPQMRQYADFLPHDLYIAAPRWAAYTSIQGGSVKTAQNAYYAAFKKMGVKPDNGHAVAWDPGLLIVSALRALGPDATSTAVRDWIEGQTGFSGVNGFYDFRNSPQRGLTIKDTVMTRWSVTKQTWEPVSKAAGYL
jgi:branched-chain amino acid transport system substrate-binding protein